MILSASDIVRLGWQLVNPFYADKRILYGMSYGLSAAGYDVRIGQSFNLKPGDFVLASTVEEFNIPNNIMAIVHDKSTWARFGLSVFNTVIEPGWKGYLTLEIKNQSQDHIVIPMGCPIAQIVFHLLSSPTDRPYSGKYQNQGPDPAAAILEEPK